MMPSDERILAVDPGNTKSGWVLYQRGRVQECGVDANPEVLRLVCSPVSSTLVIEGLQSFGKAIGQTVLDTARWIGRFEQAFFERTGADAHILTRTEVKKRLVGRVHRGDAEVRRALILRFGGSEEVAIGKKSAPGPLYSVKSHAWSALALAVVYEETKRVG
ncbi:MAG: hypothetical protein KC917_08365, partial [Candidatus Omnitrophica bacterium]|nr:hypothetical protein [Candidatus Omnitrophota bacterium]